MQLPSLKSLESGSQIPITFKVSHEPGTLVCTLQIQCPCLDSLILFHFNDFFNFNDLYIPRATPWILLSPRTVFISETLSYNILLSLQSSSLKNSFLPQQFFKHLSQLQVLLWLLSNCSLFSFSSKLSTVSEYTFTDSKCQLLFPSRAF